VFGLIRSTASAEMVKDLAIAKSVSAIKANKQRIPGSESKNLRQKSLPLPLDVINTSWPFMNLGHFGQALLW
jgi:hypothetical protein